MALLKKIEFAGYKSIKHAPIDLRQVNVLIGANGAGKSNLVSFLEFLYELQQNRLQQFALGWGAGSILFYGPKTTKCILARLDFEDKPFDFSWELCLTPTPRDSLIVAEEKFEIQMQNGSQSLSWGPNDRGSDLIQQIGLWRVSGSSRIEKAMADAGTAMVQHSDRWGIFHFSDTSSNAGIRRRCYKDDNLKLHSDGNNLAGMLFRLWDGQPAAYHRIIGTIRQIAPWFGDFVLEPIEPNATDVMLNWRDRYSDNAFGPHQLPDGALRAMALITLLLQPERDLPPLIVIDEPELGLHPAAIGVLAALLKAASLHSQIIIATQSVTLLEEFEAGDVIVVDREDGHSTFTRQDPERLKDWLEEYTLGELWQKNSIGGGPY
jgi:predicted ATPase